MFLNYLKLRFRHFCAVCVQCEDQTYVLDAWRLHAQDIELHEYLLLTYVGSLRTEKIIQMLTRQIRRAVKGVFEKGACLMGC